MDCGQYSVDVVDSEFRHASATCTVERALALDVDVRSRWTRSAWKIALDIVGADKDEVTCEWSTGQAGLVLNGVADGTYRYVLTYKNGNSLSDEIVVNDVMPSAGENNDDIVVDIGDGEYQVDNRDGPASGPVSYPVR